MPLMACAKKLLAIWGTITARAWLLLPFRLSVLGLGRYCRRSAYYSTKRLVLRLISWLSCKGRLTVDFDRFSARAISLMVTGPKQLE